MTSLEQVLQDAARAYAARVYGPVARPARITITFTDGEEIRLPIPAVVAETPLPSGPSCRQDIADTLREAGKRLTTNQLLEVLESRGRLWGESTVKRWLAKMLADGELTNQASGTPKGYGLAEWE